MAITPITLPAINRAVRDVYSALAEQCYKPPLWTNMTDDDLWRELVACILGSRVRFDVAHSALERLDKKQLLCEHRRTCFFSKFENEIMEALAGGDSTGRLNRYPFFRVRASQIRQAAERLYHTGQTLGSFLAESHDIREARRRLTLEISGLGPKQASLFLRNIGYATCVAVLDIHVLTYMSWVGLTETLHRSVSSIGKYEELEDTLINYATSCGYTPDQFDIAVWVVVKVVKEEQRTWGS